jgi:hypothetical protein
MMAKEGAPEKPGFSIYLCKNPRTAVDGAEREPSGIRTNNPSGIAHQLNWAKRGILKWSLRKGLGSGLAFGSGFGLA